MDSLRVIVVIPDLEVLTASNLSVRMGFVSMEDAARWSTAVQPAIAVEQIIVGIDAVFPSVHLTSVSMEVLAMSMMEILVAIALAISVVIGNEPAANLKCGVVNLKIKYCICRCHYPVCPPGYCMNNGRCFIRPGSSTPECDCTGTGFSGDRCSSPVCPEGYCLNGGTCHALPNGQPFCDCSLTSFTGDKCETPICTPNYCSGHGTCRVEQGRPVCDCQLEYWGPQCRLEVCPAGLCQHGGTCYPGPDRRPHCRCPEGYEGDHCEIPKTCPPGYCYHGGECTMQGGMPNCNCINTDYQVSSRF